MINKQRVVITTNKETTMRTLFTSVINKIDTNDTIHIVWYISFLIRKWEFLWNDNIIDTEKLAQYIKDKMKDPNSIISELA